MRRQQVPLPQNILGCATPSSGVSNEQFGRSFRLRMQSIKIAHLGMKRRLRHLPSCRNANPPLRRAPCDHEATCQPRCSHVFVAGLAG
jgi:hypothetical protein